MRRPARRSLGPQPSAQNVHPGCVTAHCELLRAGRSDPRLESKLDPILDELRMMKSPREMALTGVTGSRLKPSWKPCVGRTVHLRVRARGIGDYIVKKHKPRSLPISRCRRRHQLILPTTTRADPTRPSISCSATRQLQLLLDVTGCVPSAVVHAGPARALPST